MTHNLVCLGAGVVAGAAGTYFYMKYKINSLLASAGTQVLTMAKKVETDVKKDL